MISRAEQQATGRMNKNKYEAAQSRLACDAFVGVTFTCKPEPSDARKCWLVVCHTILDTPLVLIRVCHSSAAWEMSWHGKDAGCVNT